MSNDEKIDASGISGPESAKAIQEVAKTASKGLGVVEPTAERLNKFMDFCGQVLGPSIENLGLIAQNRTELWKVENGLRLREKVEKIMAENGIEERGNLPLRVGIPLIEAAACEDDDTLQDMWAGLLASSISSKKEETAKRAYVEALRQLDPIDAECLLLLFKSNLSDKTVRLFVTGTVTDQILKWQGVRNLERLGICKLEKVDFADDVQREKTIFAFPLENSPSPTDAHGTA